MQFAKYIKSKYSKNVLRQHYRQFILKDSSILTSDENIKYCESIFCRIFKSFRHNNTLITDYIMQDKTRQVTFYGKFKTF